MYIESQNSKIKNTAKLVSLLQELIESSMVRDKDILQVSKSTIVKNDSDCAQYINEIGKTTTIHFCIACVEERYKTQFENLRSDMYAVIVN